MNKYSFDVVVVGGGHAGIEAAWAAARMGSTTALISLDLEKIGTMPCNPAIGGIGKGHLVFELSAMGGLMPQLCSTTYLQARMLNTRKGPAVQGLRLQIDKNAYSKRSQEILADTPNLTLIAGRVDHISTENDIITGVILADGTHIEARSIILTTGTFLNGTIHIGQQQYEGGRRGEKGVKTLTEFFKQRGITVGRLKTGTPPRLLTSSLDFSVMEQQEPDKLDYLFEFYPRKVESSHACYITHTNETTHQIIRDNIGKSAMYSGNITGIGPRYCPSIEDKISRFAHKNSHHIFVEPEDATEQEVYPNGLSTSLPADVQEQYIRSIKGFEQAVITKLGYAIEYDFVNPRQLNQTLELKAIPNLFLAGQINGTTGYEEAASQGLIAGINAHLKAHGKDPFILERTESYIGVMIDDLITMGIDEPYRMFTSRAERRLLLRQDNAFERLMPKAYQLGLIDDAVYADFCTEQDTIAATIKILKSTYTQAQLQQLFDADADFYEIIHKHAPRKLCQRAAVSVQAACLYEPYLKREAFEVERRQQYKTMRIPTDFATKDLPGLSKELQEKIVRHTPATIADAALIPGMTPAALSLLIFKIKEYTKKGKAMLTCMLLAFGMLCGTELSATSRTVIFENDLHNFCDLDTSYAKLRPIIENLTLKVYAGSNTIETNTPDEQLTLHVVGDQLTVTTSLTTRDLLTILFTIMPQDMATFIAALKVKAADPDAYFITKKKHALIYLVLAHFADQDQKNVFADALSLPWGSTNLVEYLFSKVNVVLHANVNDAETGDLIHCTDIIIDFMDMEHNNQLGFSLALPRNLVLFNKDTH